MTLAARAAMATFVAVAATLPLQAAARRGSVAFHYGPALSAAQLKWFGRFDVLVTHDPLPPAQVATLHRHGTRLVIYEWSVAFYQTLVRRDSFEEQLLREPRALLNTTPLRGASGSADADAFYFDPETDEHASERPRAIRARLKQIGYDGLFLDTVTFEHVHPDALAEFQRRHPGITYDKAFSNFMRALRRELKDGVIITNQGYRDADDYLPFVDYDVSESLITRPAADGYELRPWNDPGDRWNSIDVLMREVIAPAAKRYPRVRFVHLNYATGELVVPVLAIARMFGADAFVARPDVTASGNESCYFAELGAAVGPIGRRGDTAVRQFRHGAIAMNASSEPMTITLREPLVELATGARASGRVTIAPHSVAMFARRVTSRGR